MGEQPASRSSGTSQTILVVDDDSTILLICTKKLEEAGFKVLQAEGSSEALKICSEYPGKVHLLLTDLLLPPPSFQLASRKNPFPRTHGHELVHHVVRRYPEIRVILMSALSDKEMKAYGIDKELFPFLKKPIDSATLIQTVQQTLAGPPVVLEKKGQKNDKERDDKDVQWYD
jgi:DNA-binding NtrC family response regulator